MLMAQQRISGIPGARKTPPGLPESLIDGSGGPLLAAIALKYRVAAIPSEFYDDVTR